MIISSINKSGLEELLENHFYSALINDVYEVELVDPIYLFTSNRLDLAFKLLYLDSLNSEAKFFRDIYSEHIRAFSLGDYSEPGNGAKDSLKLFKSAFEQTFDDIRRNGFSESKSLVPLSKDGSIVNGAHRVASAIFLDVKVSCINIDIPPYQYDFDFFYKRNVRIYMLEAAVTKFVETSSNVYIAFIWPAATGEDEKIDGIINNVVYRKNIMLKSNGAHNLLSQLYKGEAWLGTAENNYKGCEPKLLECFKNEGPVRVIAFQAPSIQEVLEIKEKIRSIFNVGKHAIHITDTKEEAVQSAHLVFNENSVHFLNNGNPNKYLELHFLIDKFKKFLIDNSFHYNNTVLDSGMVMALYGLRRASDIDYFCADESDTMLGVEGIDEHSDELEFHKESKLELIYDPRFYFIFNQVKFISFDQLYRMKGNRMSIKDINDRAIMEALLDNNIVKQWVSKQRQNIFYMKLKVKNKTIALLKLVRIYKLSRYFYRKLK